MPTNHHYAQQQNEVYLHFVYVELNCKTICNSFIFFFIFISGILIKCPIYKYMSEDFIETLVAFRHFYCLSGLNEIWTCSRVRSTSRRRPHISGLPLDRLGVMPCLWIISGHNGPIGEVFPRRLFVTSECRGTPILKLSCGFGPPAATAITISPAIPREGTSSKGCLNLYLRF